jgi:hypothetical protein
MLRAIGSYTAPKFLTSVAAARTIANFAETIAKVESMHFKRKAAAVLFTAMLAACSGNSGTIPAPNSGPSKAVQSSSQFGNYDVTFADQGTRHISGVALSRKVDTAGASWLSIRGRGFDVQYKAQSVTRIAGSTAAGPALSGTVADLPLRTAETAQMERAARAAAPRSATTSGVNRSTCLDPSDWECSPACDASMPDCGPCPDCTGGIPYPSEDFGMCYGNVTCSVNADGTGTGLLRNFLPGLACDFTLDSLEVDCFAATEFLGIKFTFTDAILTCANPVNPGYATALYADPRQQGAEFRLAVPIGPGQHVWDYPKDFIVTNGPAVTPLQPVSFTANYYKYGFFLKSGGTDQGYCRYINTSA